MSTRSAKMTTTDDRQIRALPVSSLDLDPENPRLALKNRPTQEELVEHLAGEGDLDELAHSFARNGYFWEEPLVVVPSKRANRWTVVEGNRRLTTLKLLLEPTLRKSVRPQNFPTLTDSQRTRLIEVPTVAYASREDVIPYLGFRHITGVKKWDPFAKSRYVAQLVKSGHQLGDIERMVGDSAKTVKKLYQEYVIYEQVESELDMDTTEIRENFSLLEVVLGQQSIKAALGLPRKLPDRPTESLVPADRLSVLDDILTWVFGNKRKGRSKVVFDSRDIPQKLAAVIASPEAYEWLKKHNDLEGAYERSEGELKFLLRQLTTASRSVERALGILAIHRDEELVQDAVSRLVLQMDSLKREASA